MRIALFSIGALALYGGSLFLEKVAPWGRFVPWWFAGFGGVAIALSFAFKSRMRARLGNESFGDILLNSLGLIVLILGFLSRQWIPTVAFLLEVWLFTLIFRSSKNQEGKTIRDSKV